MLAQTIQRQVPIGENVKFLLTDGREVSGRLVELSQDHVTLDSSGKRTTVLIGIVGGWEVLQDTVPLASDAPVSKTVIAEQENGADGRLGIPSDRNLEAALRSTLEIDEDFEVIKNLYAEHAAGGPVQDPRMFFGRDDLITNVANSILSSRSQSKCVESYWTNSIGINGHNYWPRCGTRSHITGINPSMNTTFRLQKDIARKFLLS